MAPAPGTRTKRPPFILRLLRRLLRVKDRATLLTLIAIVLGGASVAGVYGHRLQKVEEYQAQDAAEDKVDHDLLIRIDANVANLVKQVEALQARP